MGSHNLQMSKPKPMKVDKQQGISPILMRQQEETMTQIMGIVEGDEYNSRKDFLIDTAKGTGYTIIPPEDLTVVKRIGAGGYSQVYKAEWRGLIVAAKVLQAGETDSGNQDDTEFLKEMGMLAKMRHPNVLGLMGGYHDNQISCIVTEYS